MKNLFAIMGLATAVVLTSCGGGKAKEDEAARKKREADSLAALEQKRQDSIAAANQVVELKNVVETAQADPQFSTLVELLSNAGLVEKLSDANANYTVFAPTNDAFAKMDQKKLESLKTDLKKKQDLTDLLTYHVAAGKFAAADLKSRPELDMLDEKVLTLKVDGETLKVGNGTVTTADIQCSNGVIHVVDAVLTPPAKKSKAKPAPTTTTTTTTTTATTTTNTNTGGVGGKQTGNETQQVGGKQTGTQTQQVGGKSK
ncbi:MAG: fasciclin domain-containing protein [Flavobacteriales bacterium]|nr:fasciclin domain-containing protein [Flavobacteriales bacterium]